MQVANIDTLRDGVSAKNLHSGDIVPAQNGSVEPKLLSIAGDFDGNGTVDTIYESFVSALTHRALSKEIDGEGEIWDRNVELLLKQEPVTRLYSNIVAADTLRISETALGVRFFMNLGNLDGAPGDEFGYVINWADGSNLNTYHVMSLKDHRFTEVFKFKVNEYVSFEEKNLLDNGLIVKPLSRRQIEYKFYSDSGFVEQASYHFSQ